MMSLVKWIIGLLIAFLSHIINAQEITGIWNGAIKVQGTELPMVFKIKKEGDAYVSTLKSPKQSDQEIPVDKTTFVDQKLIIEASAFKVVYEGVLENQEIKGVFDQAGNKFPLDLKRGDVVTKVRPQDPKKPYPYKSIDVVFKNTEASGIKLSGTLTLPKDKKKPPIVVLISGSGPQNRNEEIKAANHRPFLVLSDFLTRQGIAVLRYDERGVAKSEGVFKGATSVDLASDVEAAIRFLKSRDDVDVNKIGLVGHSEGGFIAPMVASENKEVSFVVLLAGTGVDGKDVLLSQMKLSAELEGISSEIIQINNKFTEIVLTSIQKEKDVEVMKAMSREEMTTYHNTLDDSMKKAYPLSMLEQQLFEFIKDPWMRYFVRTDPKQFLSNVKTPILAINGSKDCQVITDLNLSRIEKILKKSGNKDVTISEIEGLNHLFQTAKTGSESEYPNIEETFAPEAMKMISEWILKRF
ncbi:S9 family peptidase [Aquimarina sp. Aq78]|uniref:alpha/beta hydrolase family protein n=1 Tax=Aquimarina sp. Aq78 TaxID=1191889 RepID=UPI000D0FB67B|nr:CocE/NonD family hydrolase [Aquimarina sp. Aq78]